MIYQNLFLKSVYFQSLNINVFLASGKDCFITPAHLIKKMMNILRIKF